MSVVAAATESRAAAVVRGARHAALVWEGSDVCGGRCPGLVPPLPLACRRARVLRVVLLQLVDVLHPGVGSIKKETVQAELAKVGVHCVPRWCGVCFWRPDAVLTLQRAYFGLTQMYKVDSKLVYVHGFKTPFGACLAMWHSSVRMWQHLAVARCWRRIAPHSSARCVCLCSSCIVGNRIAARRLIRTSPQRCVLRWFSVPQSLPHCHRPCCAACSWNCLQYVVLCISCVHS
jgi:hypothetical protein